MFKFKPRWAASDRQLSLFKELPCLSKYENFEEPLESSVIHCTGKNFSQVGLQFFSLHSPFNLYKPGILFVGHRQTV